MSTGFSGSYACDDVTFLLKKIRLTPTDIAEKERLIQSGARHYSEMLSQEKLPGDEYMRLFYDALTQNEMRFACDIARLVKTIASSHDSPVIVSLVRAGTPVGVLVHRGLKYLGKESSHYSISIIRDRGIDWNALDYIRSLHRDEDIIFLDGWTGKGAITKELNRTIAQYDSSRNANLDPALAVVADLAGVASLAATSDDYLIPSAVLNSIVSGLVSRSVLNSDYMDEGDFHACVYYDEFIPHDISRYFVDRLTPFLLASLANEQLLPAVWTEPVRDQLKTISQTFLENTLAEFGLRDSNRIKPGIGESTRSLLRRMPRLLFIKDSQAKDVEHLMLLAEQREVEISIRPELPYRAAVLIESLGEQ